MATSYVSRGPIPRDNLSGQRLPDLRDSLAHNKQSVTTSAASALASTVGTAVENQEVFEIYPVTTAVWAKFGTAPTATIGTDRYCPANTLSRFIVPAGHQVALIDA